MAFILEMTQSTIRIICGYISLPYTFASLSAAFVEKTSDFTIFDVIRRMIIDSFLLLARASSISLLLEITLER